ncbi:MAG: DUF481 domain-containing protein [Litorimonas sp.]
MIKTTSQTALITVAALALFPLTAQAQVADGWSGEASLTGSQTTGNTDTTDVGLGLKLAKDGDVWRHKFNASADYGRAGGTTNKQRFVLGYQIDRDITDRLYAYANADYFSDDFGAFEDGYFLGTGLGYEVIVPDPIGWKLEGGLGYRSQTPQDTLGVAADSTSEIAARLGSDFDWTLNDNVSLYNDSELIYSESDTNVWNEFGLTATLTGRLAARASVRVDHHTDVPVGLENTDTITRFGLVYTME